MFTSEPSLAQRIERMISDTPIIDPHSHIRCDQPNAPDLAGLLSEPSIQTELRSVGMPEADLNPALSPDDRVRRAIPYLRWMRNTATSWCLFRIFRDLYDFSEPQLTASNYQELMDKVAQTGQDLTWAPTVLRNRCHIETLATSLANKSTDPAKNPTTVLHMLASDYLFRPGVANSFPPFHAGKTTKAEYYDVLTSVLGERPATTERLRRLLHDWLDRTFTGSVRFSSTFISIEQRFHAPDESYAQLVLTQAADDGDLCDKDIDALVQLVTWEVMTWHHDNRKTLQIAVGAEPDIRGGKSVSRYQESWSSDMARVFSHFSNARFDLLVGAELLVQETAALARQFPNVYVSGYWGHNFVPSTIEKTIGLRIQTAPMTKIGGFLSDASSAEWTYGKLQIIKKSMASAFARLVAAGYYEEDELPPIFQQILHDTPRDLHDLGAR